MHWNRAPARRRTTLADLLHRGVACPSLNHLVRQSVRPQIETGRGVFHHWALRAGATTSGGWRFGSSSRLLLPMKSSRLVVEAGKRPDHLIAIHLELAIPLGTLHNLSIHHLEGKRIAAYGPLNPYWPLRYRPLGRPDREPVDLHFPFDLRALLLKNEPDASAAIGPCEGAFPHAGHIDRYQRPVDPVLLHSTAAHEHQRSGNEGPHGSHRRETNVAFDGPPEGPVHGVSLLNHLIRSCQQRRRNRQAKRLGRLEVDDQVELRRLLDRQIGGLGPLQDFVYIRGGSPIQIR